MPYDRPILIVSGTKDPVGDYGKGPKRVGKSLKKAGVNDITMKLYLWGRHEILHETEKLEVYNDILNWLNNKLSLTIPSDN
jgi:alpha-beta hydrolase superfamily lysophospholipase